MGEIYPTEEEISQFIFNELRQVTRGTEQNSQDVAKRIAAEVFRICNESKRIQSSGEVENWVNTLTRHRLTQCLEYYRLGRRQGGVELHSILSAIVYRYITSGKTQITYQARISIIEDFLQGFYAEALNAFRREAHLDSQYRPQTLLELAEYMAFTERYAKRRIPLPGNRSQQLIVLRAQTFAQQQPAEISIDMESAAEGAAVESESVWNDVAIRQVREAMVAQDAEPTEASLRHKVIKELMAYLEEKEQKDCADYFALRLQDLSANEIEEILGLNPRQRDYLQQRFKYHLIRFAFSHRWELVHQWLEADLDKNLGLSPQKWQEWLAQLDREQAQLIHLKKQGLSNAALAKKLGCSTTQVEKRWFKLLELAWEFRNRGE